MLAPASWPLFDNLTFESATAHTTDRKLSASGCSPFVADGHAGHSCLPVAVALCVVKYSALLALASEQLASRGACPPLLSESAAAVTMASKTTSAPVGAASRAQRRRAVAPSHHDLSTALRCFISETVENLTRGLRVSYRILTTATQHGLERAALRVHARQVMW